MRNLWRVLAATVCAISGAAGAAEPGMAERVAACAACHGAEGRSAAETYYPSIAGKPAGYLHQQMLNFRAGRRHHAVMEGMFMVLSDDYLREIAAYYAAQTPAIHASSAGGDSAMLARGRALVERGDPGKNIPSCQSCHGTTLTGAQPALPGLVGLRAEYLAAQLGAWRSGTRRGAPPDCMGEIARRLAPEDIAAVTAWIANMPASAGQRPAPTAPELPMECGGVP